MDNKLKLTIYQAQVQNVRELEKARGQIRRVINEALRLGKNDLVSIQTKVLAQTFCAWAEANFLKLILTTYGLTLDEISQVRRVWDENGITAAWIRCVDLGLRKVSAQRSGFAQNAAQRVRRFIAMYVEEPSQLRNKIAHGQWKIALNREVSDINSQLTGSIKGLTVVQIEIWFECHRHLALIVESLIESPDRTFVRDYWRQLAALEDFVESSKEWSMADKSTALKTKTARRPKREANRDLVSR